MNPTSQESPDRPAGTFSAPRSRLHQLRANVGAVVTDGFFRSISALGNLHPRARPARHGVEVVRDVAYVPDGNSDHTLDVWRPVEAKGLLPVVFYVHGGGFRILSKDTHWIMGLSFARRGFVVFNINYRLAPKHPYPAGLEDTCRAYAWVAKNAARYGGDPARIVLAGESAGANLITALAVATAYERPEPFAREVFALGVAPVAAIPACGVLQVSDVERFDRRRKLPGFISDRIRETRDAYLGGARPEPAGGLELADPLVVLERGERPARPLPPFFAAVGTRDPLLDDTRRLAVALGALGVECRVAYYPGEPHAFHALVWRPNARAFWNESFDFIERCFVPLAERAAAAATV